MLREWWSRVLALLARRRIEDDLRAEMDAHLEMEVEANLDRGMTPRDALERAKRGFGNRTLLHESSRDAWVFHGLEALIQDFRYALRILRRSPGLALTVVAVIGLGIGATTASFTLLDHVLLRPLPFPQAERLVRLYETELANGYPRIESSPPNFLDWRAMSGSFDSMGAYMGFSSNLSGQSVPLRLEGALVESEVFRTLRARPELGRGFTAEDDRVGAAEVVLLGHSLAGALFGDAAGAVGRALSLDNQAHTVVGVMPAGFSFPSRETEFWVPLRFSPQWLSLRRNHLLDVVARLRPGISVEEARADLELVAGRLERAYPKDNAGVGGAVVDLRDALSPESRMLVVAVFGAAFCLLGIASTNLANLLFARAIVRRRELALRIALGAARQRLVRQLLVESFVLAALGGALGSALAGIATPLLARFVPNGLPIASTPQVDLRVFLFAALLTVATSVAFGVGPALRSSRTPDLKALGSRSGSGGPKDRVRSMLVVAEVTSTVVLLVAAGLLVKALWRVEAVDPGFRPGGALTLRTELPEPKYGGADARRDFYTRVLSDARALPGVTSAAYTTALPMVWGAGIFPVTAPGVVSDPASAPRASIRFVTPEFFTALGIPLLHGRTLSDRDDARSPFVAVISESLARRLWPGQDPIGLTLHIADLDRTVVGVGGDVAVRGLERVSEPQTYFPVDQMGNTSAFYAPKDLVVRASGDPSTLAAPLRAIVHAADPEQPVSDVRLLEDIVSSQTAPRRDQLSVLLAFASIAFLLAAVGVHGFLSLAVSSRTQEIGVRVALGAARGDVLRMFLDQGLALGAAGALIAAPLAYAAARAMTSLLFGVEAFDPLVYGSAVVLAMLMTLAGSLRPAVRAATIDPAITIRTE